MADNRNPALIHVDEGTLHAWLDGALATDEASAVRTHIAECEACAAAAAEARGLMAASSRILSALDEVPVDVVPEAKGAPGVVTPRQRSVWSARRYASVAAVLAFAAVGALVLRHDSQGAYGNIGEQSSPAPAASAPQAQPHITAAAAPALHSREPESQPGVRVAARAKPVARDNVASAAPDSLRANGRAARGLAMASNVTAAEARVAPAPVDVPAAAGATSHISDSVTVTGRVTAAETGLPLPNASVLIAGSSAGAITDSAGFFSIGNVPPGSHTIMARRVGYAPVRQLVNSGAGRSVTLALALPAAGSMLEQVVTADAAIHKQGEFLNASPTIVGTRQISTALSTEDGRRIRRTVFAVGSGAQITLTEKSPRILDTNEAPRLRAPALSLSAAERRASQSVEWAAPDGTTLVLSGPFPYAELEAFKARVVR